MSWQVHAWVGDGDVRLIRDGPLSPTPRISSFRGPGPVCLGCVSATGYGRLGNEIAERTEMGGWPGYVGDGVLSAATSTPETGWRTCGMIG